MEWAGAVKFTAYCEIVLRHLSNDKVEKVKECLGE